MKFRLCRFDFLKLAVDQSIQFFAEVQHFFSKFNACLMLFQVNAITVQDCYIKCEIS